MREEGWKPFVLDVRSQREAEIVSLAFVDLLQPHRQVTHAMGKLPRDRDILVHCKGGARSVTACKSLAEAGFAPDCGRSMYSLEGGINAWAQEIDKSMPTY